MAVFVLGYLDAGTGSLIFQVLVASLVSAGVVFGGLMTQLRSFVSRVILRRQPEVSATGSANSSDEPVIAIHGQRPQETEHRKAA